MFESKLEKLYCIHCNKHSFYERSIDNKYLCEKCLSFFKIDCVEYTGYAFDNTNFFTFTNIKGFKKLVYINRFTNLKRVESFRGGLKCCKLLLENEILNLDSTYN